MSRLKVILGMVFLFSMAALAVAPNLKANDVWNKKTTLTFSNAFEIPGGKVLPAGTYVFKLIDHPYNREIVQITDKEQTHVYATLFTIPIQAARMTETTTVHFGEREAGWPQAVSTWFHPGEMMGHQFYYPETVTVEKPDLNGFYVQVQ